MNRQPIISIEADQVSDPKVIEFHKAAQLLSQGIIEIPIEKKENVSGGQLGAEIWLNLVLEPIVKSGLEFLIKELLDWLKKKTRTEKTFQNQYVFNIYSNNQSTLPTTVSTIGGAEATVNRLLKTLISSRNDLKGSLFSMLGRGEIETALGGIAALPDNAYSGVDLAKTKKDAALSLEKIQKYKDAHPGTRQEDWDTDFRGMINRLTFECINQLPQDLPVESVK